MLCKKCKEPMSSIGHYTDNGKTIKSYKCGKCGRWCEGRVKGETMVNVTWYEPVDSNKDESLE